MSMKKKSIQAKLSFALDDDDDNDNDYNDNKISSSSTMMQSMKKKRKIKQAPNVESINESILLIQTSSSSSSYIHSSSDYSKESLNRLKEAQNFRPINQESSLSIGGLGGGGGGDVIDDSTLLMDVDDGDVIRNDGGVNSMIHHTTTDHNNHHHSIDGINDNNDYDDNTHMNSAIDGDEILFELSGEEAEAEFIAFTERTSSSSSSMMMIDRRNGRLNADGDDSYDLSTTIPSMSYGSYIDNNSTTSSSSEGLLDHEAIYQAKLENKKMLNKEYMKERLYITTTTASSINSGRRDARKVASSTSTVTTTNYDLSLDNDRSWEDEIIKRGVINTNVLVEKNIDIDMDVVDVTRRRVSSNSSSSSSSSNDTITRKRMMNATGDNNHGNNNDDDGKNSKNVSELINTVDILGAVRVGIEKLSSNCDVVNRKTHQLESDIKISRSKELKFRAMVDNEVKQLTSIQDIKYFFASMVGMLREKQPLIDELYSTVIMNSVKEYQVLIKNRRIDEQEDRVYRLKQVSGSAYRVT